MSLPGFGAAEAEGSVDGGPVLLSSATNSSYLCFVPHTISAGRGEVVGRCSPEFLPAWVIKQGFPEDWCASTSPAASSTRASAGWGGGQDTRAPLSPEWGAGPPSPREAAPPSPRWEIRAAAAGSGRERGWAAGPAAPRGSVDKAPAAAFVPFSDGVCSNYLRPGRHMGGGGALRSGAAALASLPARCGPQPSPIPVS